MKFINYLLIMGLLLSLNLFATTVYEDGEDKQASRWHPLNDSKAGTIANVYDDEKSSQVIRLNGDGTKNAYMLMTDKNSHWNNTKEKILHWEMKYSEDFVIFISLETKQGKRYLIYTPGRKNGYMQFGLGENATDGEWQHYSRNLEKDLEYFDNRNSIISINSFVIRGSGEIDNVKLMNSHSIEEHHTPKNNAPKVKKISKKSSPLKMRSAHKSNKKKVKTKKKVLKKKSDTTPEIIMEGENPLFLAVGESFEEPGVRAEDKEDGELVITSSENIDKHKEGIYSVIYMATDSNGNSAIDKRYVYIGEPEKSDADDDSDSDEEHAAVDKVVKGKSEGNDTEDSSDDKELDDDAQYQLEERELEIAEWEKELQLREKEIAQREQSIQKSAETEK